MRPWRVMAILEGCQSRKEALQAEWRLKHVARYPTDSYGRTTWEFKGERRVNSIAFCLANYDRWTARSQKKFVDSRYNVKVVEELIDEVKMHFE